MLKSALTLLVFLAILSFPLSQQLVAQTRVTADTAKPASQSSPKPNSDLKKIIAQSEKDARDRAGEADVKPYEKDARALPKSNGLSKRAKVYIVIGAIGLAALLFVLIKYGKDCKVSNPPGCSVGVDEFCTCEQYEQNL